MCNRMESHGVRAWLNSSEYKLVVLNENLTYGSHFPWCTVKQNQSTGFVQCKSFVVRTWWSMIPNKRAVQCCNHARTEYWFCLPIMMTQMMLKDCLRLATIRVQVNPIEMCYSDTNLLGYDWVWIKTWYAHRWVTGPGQIRNFRSGSSLNPYPNLDQNLNTASMTQDLPIFYNGVLEPLLKKREILQDLS